MAKDKKKQSKKDEASNDLLELAALSLKKFRKVSKEIGKLSTGQKMVAGLALAAAGLAYLATQHADDDPAAAAPSPEAPAGSTADSDLAAPKTSAHKTRKSHQSA